MVSQVCPVYLFVGQDTLAKDTKLQALQKEFLPPDIAEFNLDIVYAHELNLKTLQEKLLLLPVKVKKRMVVVKNAQALRDELKEFIAQYALAPSGGMILVLDIDRRQEAEDFIRTLRGKAQIFFFKEEIPIDTFTLSRQIEFRKTDQALRILHQLLQNGEKPERILGGLRFVCQRQYPASLELKRRISLLLKCDLEIKTGKLKPDFALEKLVVRLCHLTQTKAHP